MNEHPWSCVGHRLNAADATALKLYSLKMNCVRNKGSSICRDYFNLRLYIRRNFLKCKLLHNVITIKCNSHLRNWYLVGNLNRLERMKTSLYFKNSKLIDALIHFSQRIALSAEEKSNVSTTW